MYLWLDTGGWLHLSQICSLGLEDVNNCDPLIEPRDQASTLLRIARAECAQEPWGQLLQEYCHRCLLYRPLVGLWYLNQSSQCRADGEIVIHDIDHWM